MAAARSPKSKAKKPSKKSVTQKKKHRKSKQRQYEKNRARDYRPRLRLPPGSYMILPVVKKEPILKKEPDLIVENQDVEKPVVIKKEPRELQEKQPVENPPSDGEALSVRYVCLCGFCSGCCLYSPLDLLQVRLQCSTSKTSRNTHTWCSCYGSSFEAFPRSRSMAVVCASQNSGFEKSNQLSMTRSGQSRNFTKT